MEQTLEERARAAKLTGKEKLAFDYIMKQLEAACLKTSNEIGAELGIGASSVVRLAKKLGFANYTALRKALQKIILAAGHASIQEQIPYQKLGDIASLSSQQLLSAYTSKVMQHILADSKSANEEKLSAAADAILAARRVYVVGFRACAGLAATFATMLRCCRPDVYLVGQNQPLVDQLVDLTEADVLIAISFSRYSKDTYFAAQMASDQTKNIIVMTDSYTAPLSKYASTVIMNTVENFSFFNSYASFVMNFEKIVLLVGYRSIEETQTRLAKMESYLEKTNQY